MPAGNIEYGQTTIGGAATQVSTKKFQSLAIKSHSGNDVMYVGDANVTTGNGFQLSAGESFYINELLPPGFLYLAGTNGDKVSYFGVTYADR